LSAGGLVRGVGRRTLGEAGEEREKAIAAARQAERRSAQFVNHRESRISGPNRSSACDPCSTFASAGSTTFSECASQWRRAAKVAAGPLLSSGGTMPNA
jgi:hypothetical protein